MFEYLSLKEYTELVKKRLFSYNDSEKAKKFLESDKAKEYIEGCYKADLEDYKTGEISYEVLTNGCINAVANCLDLMVE